MTWTLVDLDYASEGFSLVTNTSLKGFIQYPICKIKWWDYFIEIGNIKKLLMQSGGDNVFARV